MRAPYSIGIVSGSGITLAAGASILSAKADDTAGSTPMTRPIRAGLLGAGAALRARSAAHHRVDGRHGPYLQAVLGTHTVPESEHPPDRFMSHDLAHLAAGRWLR